MSADVSKTFKLSVVVSRDLGFLNADFEISSSSKKSKNAGSFFFLVFGCAVCVRCVAP